MAVSEGGGADWPGVCPHVPAGDLPVVAAPGEDGGLPAAVRDAGEGAGAGQQVTVSGGILHAECEPVTRRSSAAKELRAAVSHRQLGASVSGPGHGTHGSPRLAPPLDGVTVDHHSLRVRLGPASQLVFISEVGRVDLHGVVLLHLLLHHVGQTHGTVQEGLVLLDLLEVPVDLVHLLAVNLPGPAPLPVGHALDAPLDLEGGGAALTHLGPRLTVPRERVGGNAGGQLGGAAGDLLNYFVRRVQEVDGPADLLGLLGECFLDLSGLFILISDFLFPHVLWLQ